VLGVTKLDVVRAKAFIGQITGTDPKEVSIPVVGGHAGTTILPLLSQVQPSEQRLAILTIIHRIPECCVSVLLMALLGACCTSHARVGW
jgi:malate/lactate dehydrogenase